MQVLPLPWGKLQCQENLQHSEGLKVNFNIFWHSCCRPNGVVEVSHAHVQGLLFLKLGFQGCVTQLSFTRGQHAVFWQVSFLLCHESPALRHPLHTGVHRRDYVPPSWKLENGKVPAHSLVALQKVNRPTTQDCEWTGTDSETETWLDNRFSPSIKRNAMSLYKEYRTNGCGALKQWPFSMERTTTHLAQTLMKKTGRER